MDLRGACVAPLAVRLSYRDQFEQHEGPLTGRLWDTVRMALEQHPTASRDALVPIAEEAQVRLAAHPDDPPLEFVRGQPRLVHRPDLHQRLLDRRPSRSNSLELCIGTLAEMPDPNDLYSAIDRYSRQGAIAYAHCRNVHGRAPHYREIFIDDGDVDMVEALRILQRNGYRGRHSRPRAATQLCRTLARRHGVHLRLVARRARPRRRRRLIQWRARAAPERRP